MKIASKREQGQASLPLPSVSDLSKFAIKRAQTELVRRLPSVSKLSKIASKQAQQASELASAERERFM